MKNTVPFSEHRLLAMHKFRSRRPLLVDVGAHHGSACRTFAERGWQVIAFEPEHDNYTALIRNLSGFDNATCIPKAVADVTGKEVPFYVSDEHYGIHSLKPFHETHRLAYEVETVTLNDALEALNIEAVTLLKIDTEGADFLALKGFDCSRYDPEVVMVEFMDERTSPHFGYTHHDVATHMKEQGYTAFISEWEPITEYAREGVPTPPHTWIQCVPYPLDHEPSWGNLIFVPQAHEERFKASLEAYLDRLQRGEGKDRLRKGLKRIPGGKLLLSLLGRGR